MREYIYLKDLWDNYRCTALADYGVDGIHESDFYAGAAYMLWAILELFSVCGKDVLNDQLRVLADECVSYWREKHNRWEE